MAGNLPDGVAPPRRTSITFCCVNPACAEHNVAEELAGTADLGVVELDDDGAVDCYDCGWTRISDSDDGKVVTTRTGEGAQVIVDRRKERIIALLPSELWQKVDGTRLSAAVREIIAAHRG